MSTSESLVTVNVSPNKTKGTVQVCPVKDLEMRTVLDYLPVWAQGHHQALKGVLCEDRGRGGKRCAAGSEDKGGAMRQGMQVALSWKRPGMDPLLETPVGMDFADTLILTQGGPLWILACGTV